MIKLVLADMDGTLVPFTADSTSMRTLAAIDALRARGIEFGCATGRTNFDVTAHFHRRSDCTATGIYASGRQVFLHGEQLLSEPMPHDILAEVACGAARSDDWLLVPLIDGFNPRHPNHTAPVLIGEDPAKVARIMGGRVDPKTGFSLWRDYMIVDEVPDVEVYCVGALVEGGQARIGSLYRQFHACFPNLTLLNSADGWCDVVRGSSTKATPFPLLLEAMGLSAGEVVFVADSDNDIELMKLVPHAVCVASGTASARAHARHLIPSADDDGPAQLMEALAATAGDLDAALSLLR